MLFVREQQRDIIMSTVKNYLHKQRDIVYSKKCQNSINHCWRFKYSTECILQRAEPQKGKKQSEEIDRERSGLGGDSKWVKGEKKFFSNDESHDTSDFRWIICHNQYFRLFQLKFKQMTPLHRNSFSHYISYRLLFLGFFIQQAKHSNIKLSSNVNIEALAHCKICCIIFSNKFLFCGSLISCKNVPTFSYSFRTGIVRGRKRLCKENR